MPGAAPNPWAHPACDPVRDVLEREWLGRLLNSLLHMAPGARVLDLGSGDGTVRELIGDRAGGYLGVDLFPTSGMDTVRHDLRDGLGAAGDEPFDLYVGSFGVASHLAPAELRRLMAEIATSASAGATVAVEALGLFSLEWPALWDSRPGEERTLRYRLAGEVQIHPWSPAELAGLAAECGLRPLATFDRTVQYGPKLGDDGYWPGLPPLRAALRDLLHGSREGGDVIGAALPPLPAHPAARAHHALAARRRRLVERLWPGAPAELARAAWALEPRTGAGIGHGLMLLARAD
jgi:hypothetical protein